MPQYIQRQKILATEIEQMESLLERMQQLRTEANGQTVSHAHRLQTNRWYELRLIEEAQVLQNRLDFLRVELADVTVALTRMSHKKQRVSEKAQEAYRLARIEREAYLEQAHAVPSKPFRP